METRIVSLFDTDKKEFGCAVRKKRISSDWSLQRLAAEVNRSIRTIIYLEKGKHCVRPSTIDNILKIWPDLSEKLTSSLENTH